MTILGKAIAEPGPIPVRRSACRTALTERAQNEIERLSESLFFRKGRLNYKSALMMDLGGNTSSLWVATSVAGVLEKALRNTVHVLTVGMDVSEIHEASNERELDLGSGVCFLEHIGHPTSTAAGMNMLFERLSAVKADGRVAIVHWSQAKDQALNFPRVDFVDGVILIVRAAQTRRAILEVIERQLVSVGTPLLGSVLLDRDYPIPEMLYRLL